MAKDSKDTTTKHQVPPGFAGADADRRLVMELQAQVSELRAQLAKQTPSPAPASGTESDALARMVGNQDLVRLTGFLIQEMKGERYVVHAVTGGAGVASVQPLEKGEAMPWHAARDTALRHFDLKVTPEGKR